MQIQHHEPVKVHDCFISYMLEISHAEDESTGLDLDLGVESYHYLVTQYSSSKEEEAEVAGASSHRCLIGMIEIF